MKQVQEIQEKEQKTDNKLLAKERETKKRKVIKIQDLTSYLITYILINYFFVSGKKQNQLIIIMNNQMETLKYLMQKKIFHKNQRFLL